jgi:hypothetical protein
MNMIKAFSKFVVFLLAIFIVFVAFDRYTPYSIFDRLKLFDWPPGWLQEPAPAQPVEVPFFKLSLDEKIKRSSIILRTEYIGGEEILVEVFKRDAGTEFYFDIGDEYDPFEGFRDSTVDYGEGNIAFLTGSPANLKMSMAYSDNQVPDQDNVTLDIIRQKCGKQPIIVATDKEPNESAPVNESTESEANGDTAAMPETVSPDIARR